MSSKPHPSSYGQILKSSSIIGGAQGLNYIIGMVRTKFVAVLLGPSGVGLVGLYMSATSLVGAFSELGIGSSGVREVAEAHGKGAPEQIAQTIKTLRRACWVTGILGWFLTAALSYPLSIWTFGSGAKTWEIALLGATLLLGSISGGQTALLQGVRRIGDLARLNVVSVLATTLIAVFLYYWLGERGIVPVLLITAVFNLAASWWFARRVEVDDVDQPIAETWLNSKRLVGLGLAIMWSGLLNAGVALAIRSLIVRNVGIEANGIYQAAWGISGMFASFILGAMGYDFYPRLTAVADDNHATRKLINEQTEIGILLALPGIIGTLAFAPLVMRIFYTTKFLPGAYLLPWFVLGVFGKVISWPMGFILLAKGASRWFVAIETAIVAINLILSIVFLHWIGLWGVALAFMCIYVCYTLGMLWLSDRLIQFRWSDSVCKLLLVSGSIVAAAFCIQQWVPGLVGLALGGLLTVGASILSLRGIAVRLGSAHRVICWVCKIPGGRIICGI